MPVRFDISVIDNFTFGGPQGCKISSGIPGGIDTREGKLIQDPGFSSPESRVRACGAHHLLQQAIHGGVTHPLASAMPCAFNASAGLPFFEVPQSDIPVRLL